VEFLDTNLIIRFLAPDNPAQAARAYLAFQAIETGQLTVMVSEGILVEAVYVLSSKTLYNLPREDIKKHLANILALKGFKIPYKKTYLRALDLYLATNIDFVDALSIAHMERCGITTILSFDRDFDRVKTVSRREP